VSAQQVPEQYFTPAQVGKQLQFCANTVIKLFVGRPGVVVVQAPRGKGNEKQRYRNVRISQSALNRWIVEHAS
jgi:hypothetical protein